jgi:heparanase 1
VLAIYTSRTQLESIELPMPAQRYTLAAEKLEDAHVQLNGHEPRMAIKDELPPLPGEPTSSGHVELAPASITFLAFPKADNGSCR